jgi:hypothetical protein
MGLPECSRFLSTEVDGAQDGSWRRCCFAWPYFTAKPSHMRVDVDGLAYPLHHPIVCGMSGAAPFRRAVVGSDAFSRGARPPRFGYLMRC